MMVAVVAHRGAGAALTWSALYWRLCGHGHPWLTQHSLYMTPVAKNLAADAKVVRSDVRLWVHIRLVESFLKPVRK